MRQDILRGVRLAAILFAIILVALTSYRMLHVSAAPAAQPEARDIEPVGAKAAPAVVAVPGGAEVPPPPPVSARSNTRWVTRRPPVSTGVEAATPTEAASLRDTTPTPVAAPEPAPVVAAQPEPVPHAVAADDSKEVSAPPTETAQTQGPHGKRWVHAVGRFLHVGGKKDAQPQSVR
jgi:hypothetical protein